jgi:hypothetical protein
MRLADYFTSSTQDPWGSVAPEKIDHVVYGAALWFVLTRLPLPLLSGIALFLVLAAGWEVLELIRYLQWRHACQIAATVSPPQPAPPRPEVCDLFSYRDVCRDALGAVLAAGVLLLPARF